jgi:lysyl-tRNA synthetase class 2
VSEANDKYEADRRAKLERIAALGVDPWGQRFSGRQAIGPARKLWRDGAEHGKGPKVRVAGRVMGKRDQGKVRFFDLWDWSGTIQVFVGQKQVGDIGWQIAQLVDLGDFIGIDGELNKTRMGELTVFAEQLHFLTKCLAQPPEKWHGLQDKELRYRQRYVDLVYNPDVLETFLLRSRIVSRIREFLTAPERGFLEVETPTLHTIAGGAAARPFTTHHNTLDMQLVLRIALELHLKRLMVGGIERVFEIGRVFRNEGISTRHNPEFTMLELYQAYGDYTDMMELTESLIVTLIDMLGPQASEQDGAASSTAASAGPADPRKRTIGSHAVDFTPPWPRRAYAELFQQHVGANIDDLNSVQAAAKRHGIEIANKHSDVVVAELFEAIVEDQLVGPVFVIDYPASLCPLTKRKRGNDRIAERFELFIAGMEVANAYTELNDPLLQEQLFRQQLEGLPEEESMAKMDEDFIRAQKQGMPPAGGLGIGIDRLVMLLTNQPSIRDVILFPLLRPEVAAASMADASE